MSTKEPMIPCARDVRRFRDHGDDRRVDIDNRVARSTFTSTPLSIPRRCWTSAQSDRRAEQKRPKRFARRVHGKAVAEDDEAGATAGFVSCNDRGEVLLRYFDAGIDWDSGGKEGGGTRLFDAASY